MGIIFTCPDCSKVYNFKEYLRGKKARCRDCNAIIVIDDVEDVEVLPEDVEEESFELPPQTLRKKRRKKRKRSDFASVMRGVTGNEVLRETLHTLFGTTLGQIAIGSVSGIVLMLMGASGWFGRVGFIVHSGILLGGFLFIAACFVGAVVDVCRDDSNELGSIPLMNLFTLLLYMLFSSNAAQTRRYFFVACCCTFSFILATGFVRPQGGWGKYREDADDWWVNRPIDVPMAQSTLPAAVPMPADPVPSVLPELAADARGTRRPGQMILSTNLVSYRGTVDATTAARVALRPLGWIDADNVEVNLQDKKIIMPCLGGSIAGGEARQALEQAGFEVQGQSMTTVK
ncbi:MAG: hypothetical protein JWN70_4619 [Planctomycetaceae bacterium]|nr:hypothetical protein [Planctomycetaceae bacterium]